MKQIHFFDSFPEIKYDLTREEILETAREKLRLIHKENIIKELQNEKEELNKKIRELKDTIKKIMELTSNYKFKSKISKKGICYMNG